MTGGRLDQADEHSIKYELRRTRTNPVSSRVKGLNFIYRG